MYICVCKWVCILAAIVSLLGYLVRIREFIDICV